MIASPLEGDLVNEIAAVDPRLEVLFDPTLLPSPRFPSDHVGDPGFRRAGELEARWRRLLDRAEVAFGYPRDAADGFAELVRGAPRLRWVHGTSAGAGEHVRAAELTAEELERVAVTSSSGVHAVTLAEFCLFGLLAFASRQLPRLLADQRERRWGHYPTGELRGRTLLVLGLGAIGIEVARLARAFGMRVLAVRRGGGDPPPEVDELHRPDRLKELLPRTDDVAIVLPLTAETRGMFDREAIALMKPHSVLVNVGRGAVVDEPALVQALREGRIAGAALDVFETEPLPPESPLWELPNVLLSPHTAALSERENARIVEIFTDNLRRYLAGEPLRNRVDTRLFY